MPHLSWIFLQLISTTSISTGVAGRLPRINPRDNMNYKDWTIPAGVRAFVSIPTIDWLIPTLSIDPSINNTKAYP